MRNALIVALVTAAVATPARAQSVPFSDTEDASLNDVDVGRGRLHPIARADLRNGDYARGAYDDDGFGLDRVPVHVEVGLVYDLHRTTDGRANAWLEFHSSNGLHAPSGPERTAPRAWYESNTLVGLVVTPAAGLRTAVSYTIKASPNAVSPTTHETSLALSYDGDHGLRRLHPSAAATWRPKGGGGLYLQFGVEPERDLGSGDEAPSVSVPLLIGVGTRGFYEAGTGMLAYASAGLAYTQPLRFGPVRSSIRAELSALIREGDLARLDDPAANSRKVVPLGQVTLTFAR